MRKFMLILISAILLFTCTACSATNKNSQASSESAAIGGLAGGWTVNTEMTDDAKKIFDEAMADEKDASYEPIAFATQVVNGTNYAFICKATAGEREYFAKVVIYQPLQGDLEVTSIEEI